MAMRLLGAFQEFGNYITGWKWRFIHYQRSTFHYISLARYNDFSLHHVPRNQVSVADHLAKKARVNNQGYVISWQNY
ncbi:hypothetical protein HID58_086919 [Brassica napus]|uniref:Uncharacterized protein n=1 Tax=Brassica napus TaxID=3708 RepID=A0ABQ7XUE4_BRANA|nr:hypothetical protein HID58_086919 [Brassica napus]